MVAERPADRVFRYTVLFFGLVSVGLAMALFVELTQNSHLTWKKFGAAFLWTGVWDPVQEVYGALPFIFGTVVSSALALLISIPLGLGSAIFLAELAPRRISDALTFLIELLAAIPSVILGLMGIFLLVPLVGKIEGYGYAMLTAALILAIMTLPFITSVSRDVILSVPGSLKEALLGLGATRWEVVKTVVLPYARSGILGSGFLALGRALGETMAVTMVIGNTTKISGTLFDPGYSMAAVIANEFTEATSDEYIHALIAIGLTLFCMTVVVNGLARLMIHYTDPLRRGAR